MPDAQINDLIGLRLSFFVAKWDRGHGRLFFKKKGDRVTQCLSYSVGPMTVSPAFTSSSPLSQHCPVVTGIRQFCLVVFNCTSLCGPSGLASPQFHLESSHLSEGKLRPQCPPWGLGGNRCMEEAVAAARLIHQRQPAADMMMSPVHRRIERRKVGRQEPTYRPEPASLSRETL